MAKSPLPYDLTDPEVRQRLGLRVSSAETVSESEKLKTPARYQKRTQVHVSRRDRLDQIVKAVEAGASTRLEIGRCIGVAKSPHLLALIDELVSVGILYQYADTFRGLPAWRYALAPDV